MKKEPLIFIKHILGSIENIESFSRGLSKSEFSGDRLRQSAVIREIEIIGEAVKNLPTEFTVKYPSVEWSRIAGTRDKVIHHYFGVDADVIWDIIEYDLPDLKEKIKKIQEDLETS
ncbi:MAG: DUF86 domain-containing protein [Candidatus Altiarchaeota archaeon]|nr:DUF86 domain-containing protein [Candidatus Altiarchaeota archaeon]